MEKVWGPYDEPRAYFSAGAEAREAGWVWYLIIGGFHLAWSTGDR